MFNEKAAQWAQDMVMAMDPGEAEVFAKMLMSDVLSQDIASNQRTVNSLVTKIHKAMVEDVAKMVAKGMVTEEVAADVISKAYGRGDDKHARGKDGKFSSIDTLGAGGARQGKKVNAAYSRKQEKRLRRMESFVEENPAAALDLITALDSRGKYARTHAGAAAVDSEAPIFQQRWAEAGRNTQGSSTAETYRRIQAGSQLVGAVGAATGMQQAQIAGAVGQFVGQYGPEAEKVVGPSVRRAAYRYRGVERKPDADLTLRVQQIHQQAGQGASGDAKRGLTARATMGYLNSKVPSMRLAEIQRKSGRVAPSEGVIIDGEGNVVAQAFGHADDHYLPFNLKNLGKLKGGEYVRTRTTGGLTSEDIYTGLMAGAKQVTVVSNSGVFSVKFADDLKGARRYGDKARSMVGRYEKTLDTIRNGKLERIAVTPQVKAELLEQAEEERPPSVYQRAEIQDLYRAKVDEYKNSPSLTNGEMAAIERAARKEAGDDTESYRLRRTLKMDEAMEAKAQRIYRLDGDGYSTALDAMQEQYPYFIQDIRYSSRNEQMTNEGRTTGDAQEEYAQGAGRQFTASTDKGYVKPKHNRPEDVLEGFYDPSIRGAGSEKMPGSESMSGKHRADRTDFQNWTFNPLNEKNKAPEAPATGEAKPAAPGAPKPRTGDERSASAAKWSAENNSKALKAAEDGVGKIPAAAVKQIDPDGETYPILASLGGTALARREKLGELLKDQDKRGALADELDSFSQMASNADAGVAINTAAQALRGTVTPNAAYDPTKAGSTVFGFSDHPGHIPGANEAEVADAYKKAEGKIESLKPFFGDDADAAMKVVAAAAKKDSDAFVAAISGFDQAQQHKLRDMAASGALERAGEGYARIQQLRHLHGRREPKESSSLSSRSVPPTASTAPTSPSTSEKTGVKQVKSEQPKEIAPAPKRSEGFETVLADLDRMVGQDAIKREVRTMANYLEVQKARKDAGLPTDDVGGHMVFMGNPGTGKTTVARMVGRLYAAAGLLPSGHVVEVGRSGLVGEYAGQTAPKVEDAVDAAMGGVLFVDEAYTLAGDKYGQEAIDTLMTRMENDRGKFVVIAAGYDKNMEEFYRSNPGLESRFSSKIQFQDYSPKELGQIFSRMAAKDGYDLDEDAAKQMATDISALHAKRGENFANGRTVRQYWENAKKSHANRVVGTDDAEELSLITAEDLKGVKPSTAVVRAKTTEKPKAARPAPKKTVRVRTAEQDAEIKAMTTVKEKPKPKTPPKARVKRGSTTVRTLSPEELAARKKTASRTRVRPMGG